MRRAFFLLLIILIPLVHATASCSDIHVESVLRMQDEQSIILSGPVVSVDTGVLIRLEDGVQVERIPLGVSMITVRLADGSSCTILLPEGGVNDTPPASLDRMLPSVPDWLILLERIVNVSLTLTRTLEAGAQASCREAEEAYEALVTPAREACRGLTREDLEHCTTAECIACKQAYTILREAEGAMLLACERVTCNPVLTREAHATTYEDPIFGGSACSQPASSACEEEYARVQQPRCPGFNLTRGSSGSACGIRVDPMKDVYSAFTCQCYPLLSDTLSTLQSTIQDAKSCFESMHDPAACLEALARQACEEAVRFLTPACLTPSYSGDGGDAFTARLICQETLSPQQALLSLSFQQPSLSLPSLVCPEGNTSMPCLCPLDEEMREGDICTAGEACAYGAGCVPASVKRIPQPYQRIDASYQLTLLPEGVHEGEKPIVFPLEADDGRIAFPAWESFLGKRVEEGILTREGLVRMPGCVERDDWLFTLREEDGLVWLIRMPVESPAYSLAEKRILLRKAWCDCDTPRGMLIGASLSE